jgi:hypothetical protein
VSALKIRRGLRRHRRRVTLLVAVACVIVAHHSGLLMDMHHDDAGMGAVAEMCVAVFTAVGAALVAVGVAVLALGRWRPVSSSAAIAAPSALHVPVARARDGPAAVSFLCVSRR